MVEHGAQGGGIEAQLGEGEVVVVDDGEVGGLLAGELSNLGALAADLAVDQPVADQTSPLEPVEADAYVVGAQGGVGGRRRLHDREARDPATRDLDLGTQ